ncbi:hypothetical protein EYC80_000363 [Monilinia laxa]|uniref:RBR-type E3 ubiquitin transferase n=1 Tax=Monilinia laxa TaxID=61186 RepID=A0A5N6KAE2_MONLA|nr:hypothetical protein EYC80_000363 [Monilinia laxa]
MGFDYNESSEVFGLNYKDHDVRKIRYILNFYGELPENQGSKLALFLRLQALEKELLEGVCQKIEDWLTNGGDLPNRHPEVEATNTVIDTSGGLNEGANPSDEVDDEEVTDYDVTEDGLTDEDIPFEQYLPEDMESYLQRHPEFDLLDLVPQHPDNPERAAYMMGEEDTPPPSSDSEDDSEEKETDEEEEEEEEEEEKTDERGDYDDGEEADDERNETDTETDPATAESNFAYHTETRFRRYALVECSICAEMTKLWKIYQHITGKCDHPHGTYTCQQCLDKYIITTMEDGFLNRIKCPICPAVLTLKDISKASRTVFERYKYLSDRASRAGNFIECLGPNCGAGQVHEGSEPVMICCHCKFKTCVKHKLPWHEGLSCDDFDIDESQIERLEQAEATAKLLAKDSRICPKYKECVMRTEGCDHMLCNCGNSWCYLCGADSENIIRYGPTAHSRNCPNNPDPHKLSQSQMEARETHLTQLVHGGPINERLNQARYARNAARREQMRPLALAAAEQRLKNQTSEKTKSV